MKSILKRTSYCYKFNNTYLVGDIFNVQVESLIEPHLTKFIPGTIVTNLTIFTSGSIVTNLTILQGSNCYKFNNTYLLFGNNRYEFNNTYLLNIWDLLLQI